MRPRVGLIGTTQIDSGDAMTCMHKTVTALIATFAFSVPGIASAATITQSFGIQVPPGTSIGAGVNVPSSSFQQFDPAAGPLTEIRTVLDGVGSWSSSSAAPRLVLSLVTSGTQIVLAGERYFFTPGGVRFSFDGVDRYLPELGSFIGSGTAQVDLRISGDGGAFSTPLNSGSISYVYDPQPATVPEPAGALLVCIGLVALAAARGERPAGS